MGDLPSLRLDPPERRVIFKAVRSSGGSETSLRVSAQGGHWYFGPTTAASVPLPEASFLGFDPPQGG